MAGTHWRHVLLLAAVFGAQAFAAPAPARSANVTAPSGHYRYAAHGDFQVFIEDFRRAVIADDRAAVARMTAFPFRDFGTASEPVGTACDRIDDECTPAQARAKRTSRTPTEFLERYPRIITPAVKQSLSRRRIRAASAHPDPDDDGPIVPGEYLLDSRDIDEQRVFARDARDGRYRMVRIPFYP